MRVTGDELRDRLPRVRTQAAVLLGSDVVKMLAALDERGGIRAERDAAVIALGFSAALRGGELAALNVTDIEYVDTDRLIVHIRRSKTDQGGIGQQVPVIGGEKIRPITRLRNWQSLLPQGGAQGPLFRRMLPYGHDRIGRARLGYDGILDLVRSAAEAVGITGKVTPHSLRAGFATSAARAGARPDQIMRVTRHRRVDTVMGYIRDADQWSAHAGREIL